jgi:hypothetical protein
MPEAHPPPASQSRSLKTAISACVENSIFGESMRADFQSSSLFQQSVKHLVSMKVINEKRRIRPALFLYSVDNERLLRDEVSSLPPAADTAGVFRHPPQRVRSFPATPLPDVRTSVQQ